MSLSTGWSPVRAPEARGRAAVRAAEGRRPRAPDEGASGRHLRGRRDRGLCLCLGARLLLRLSLSSGLLPLDAGGAP